MKKQLRKNKQVPVYFLGSLSSMSSTGGSGSSGIMNMIGGNKSGENVGALGAGALTFMASNQKEVEAGDTNVRQASLAGAASGVSAGSKVGSKIGSMAGPVGSLVGGVIGGAIGGGFGYRDAKWAATDAHQAFLNSKFSMKNNKANMELNDAMQNNLAYDDTNSGSIQTFKLGGVKFYANGTDHSKINSYINDGEVIKSPSGNIDKVNGGDGTIDSIPANLEDGSGILSSTLKAPNGKTYAEMAKNFDVVQKKANKVLSDRNATNIDKQTARLNLKNAEAEFNKLLSMQETEKVLDNVKSMNNKFAKGGLKLPKYKYGIYGSSDTEDSRKAFFGDYKSLTGKNVQWGDMNNVLDKQIGGGSEWDTVGAYKKYLQTYKPASSQQSQTVQSPQFQTTGAIVDDNMSMSNDPLTSSLRSSANTTTTAGNTYFDSPILSKGETSGMFRGAYVPSENASTTQPAYSATDASEPSPSFKDYFGINDKKQQEGVSPESAGSVFNFKNLSGGVGRMMDYLPAAYDLKRGLTEKIDYLNPTDYQMNSRMKPNRFDIEPQLRQSKINSVVSRYNNAKLNTNTGADMAYGAAVDISRNRTDADLYSNKFNIDNASYNDSYKFNAQQDQYNKAVGLDVKKMNMQSEEKKKLMVAKGLKKLTEANQQHRLEDSQKENDRMKTASAMLNSGRVLSDKELDFLYDIYGSSGYLSGSQQNKLRKIRS